MSSHQDLREALARTAQALSAVQAELDSQVRKTGRMARRCQETEANNMLLVGENRTLQQRIRSLELKAVEESEARGQLTRALSYSLRAFHEEEAKREARRARAVAGKVSFWDFLPAQYSEKRAIRPEERTHSHRKHEAEEDDESGKEQAKGTSYLDNRLSTIKKKAAEINQGGTLASLLRRNGKRPRNSY
ncbi:hypothetical protein BCV69DRAFT_188622 [Microstroma glucosiphilum]|uniref:Uncharacterized protein n=1 Tax=Pseudomicrostroma glucosiphilum TaxID=1684307 RepID=A0A316U9J3_9BASI|nr:hypothetical protein BCV69DRAFT_188622 [Pseudomicrostroma glucosiphilum]PWN21151.1 hypothetical protein BCV69DRAFT_188622 [Pseudomicrostroma glucosiphilum]